MVNIMAYQVKGGRLEKCVQREGYDNRHLKNSVVWNNVRIGENCKLGYSVVKSGLKIASEKRMKENSFIFD